MIFIYIYMYIFISYYLLTQNAAPWGTFWCLSFWLTNEIWLYTGEFLFWPLWYGWLLCFPKDQVICVIFRFNLSFRMFWLLCCWIDHEGSKRQICPLQSVMSHNMLIHTFLLYPYWSFSLTLLSLISLRLFLWKLQGPFVKHK